ncbi:MAG TPA: hypothetical protein VMZ22_09400 [Acidimicrobiales bacterium]|nr:hypothetical protein [Acidimicrobiales bacterium]
MHRGSLQAGTTALIPAAGPVSEGILALSNVSSPAMIPVAGRPVIHWTLDYLLELGVDRVRIGVPRPGLFLEQLVSTIFGSRCEIDYVVVDPRGSVGDAVAALLPPTPDPHYLVVFGDTLFKLADDSGVPTRDRPTLLTGVVEESYRWLTVTRDADGNVATFHDKEPGLELPLEAAIGVLHVPHGAHLHDAFARLSAPVGFRALVESVQAVAGVEAEVAGEWLDCGNPDRQAEAQRTLLQQRAFNSIEVDSLLGSLTKRSEVREKFLNELNYLRLVPADLQVLFPRVLAFDDSWDSLSITMEFYGYPTLAELFVFENVDVSIWQRVFRHLHSVLVEQLGARRKPLPTNACASMYLGKVRERNAGGLGDLLDELVRAERVVVNGVTYPGVLAMLEELEPVVAKLESSAWGSIIHGDLCFSNILYDLRSGICKLIDPRGSFSEAGIYGDLRYDVAKLWHSVEGGFDFITADLFSLESRAGFDFTLELMTRDAHRSIADAFEQRFFDDGSFDRREIEVITALIFLGLPALHYDAPSRQVAFLLRGLELAGAALASA